MPLKDLQELRNQVTGLLDGATDKVFIEKVGKIGATIDSIEKVHTETETKLADTTSAYADMVRKTSFPSKGEKDEVEEQAQTPSLEELITQELEKESKTK